MIAAVTHCGKMHSESDDALLLAHGLPAQLLQAIREDRLPKPLCYGLCAPNCDLAAELQRVIPALIGFIPIFEQNGEAVIGLLPRSKQFIRFYYEDGNRGESSIEVLGTGYTHFASKLLLENEEAGLSEYYESLVNFLQFPLGAELRNLLDAKPYDDDAVQSFRAGLAAS